MEGKVTYWLNPNRPDYQYMFNGAGCRRRKVGTEKWFWHDVVPPAWPSEFRYEVALGELDRDELEPVDDGTMLFEVAPAGRQPSPSGEFVFDVILTDLGDKPRRRRRAASRSRSKSRSNKRKPPRRQAPGQ